MKPIPTKAQLKVASIINDLGFEVTEEKECSPYFVDIYIPEINLGVEVDGKGWHISKKMDKKRDLYIYENYGIPIIRVQVGQKKEEIEKKIMEFVETKYKHLTEQNIDSYENQQSKY
jgi:very-short-patch-repair endonuclease